MTDNQSASDRIANAPRAWAVKGASGIIKSLHTEATAKRMAKSASKNMLNLEYVAVPIALVELTEEEAGK